VNARDTTFGRMKKGAENNLGAARKSFLEWTDRDRLRPSKVVGPRDDKDARSAGKEHSDEV
jgi:hypothetical protein